ncbi:MAG TPA: hypothetical protein VEP12_20245 [Candidatus Acidoferrum sp.]|jgi:hypothetical protein|nr:hypothetical protein [Candidatus Acidoferrum sp.]
MAGQADWSAELSMMSMIGLAASPGIAVLPKCPSSKSASPASAARIALASASYWAGQLGS